MFVVHCVYTFGLVALEIFVIHVMFLQAQALLLCHKRSAGNYCSAAD